MKKIFAGFVALAVMATGAMADDTVSSKCVVSKPIIDAKGNVVGHKTLPCTTKAKAEQADTVANFVKAWNDPRNGVGSGDTVQ